MTIDEMIHVLVTKHRLALPLGMFVDRSPDARETWLWSIPSFMHRSSVYDVIAMEFIRQVANQREVVGADGIVKVTWQPAGVRGQVSKALCDGDSRGAIKALYDAMESQGG